MTEPKEKNKKASQPRRVALTTLGCKVNQYETSSFQTAFEEQGLRIVPFSQAADIYIINTCAVTGKAAAESRRCIRRALRANPGARIVVTGCFAQVAAGEIIELGDAPICIVGNGNKHLLVEIALATEYHDLEMYTGDIGRKKEISLLSVRRFAGRTRAYLKIQDGCDRFCSYCIVPYARGRSRSLEPGAVMAQAGVFAAEGYREVVITGIHVGMYGRDLEPPLDLSGLLHHLDEQGGHDFRYRLSSLEPMEITDAILDLMEKSDRFMPHLHIPLQSGSEVILKKMNRRYSPAMFRDVAEKCHSRIPDICIGADVLVGFPGEDEAAFAETLELVTELPVAYLHVFPYSKRPGTPAAVMPDQVPAGLKEERVALLRELDHKKRTAFYAKQIGKVLTVLAEGDNNRFRLMRGFTANYVPVHFEAPKSAVNTLLDVKIDRLVDNNVFGRVVSFV